MYIEDMIGDKGAFLDSAMRHPALMPKRNPTLETAMKCVLSELERACHTTAAKDYEGKLNDLYLTYTLMNGERDEQDVSAIGDWDEGLDSEVEKLFEPITEHLSASWLGEKTIDTRLHEDGEIAKLAASVGKELYKTLTYGKEPGQVLSNAGIMKTDVEAFFDAHMQPKTPEQEKANMAAQEQTVSGIAATIRETIGDDFDQIAVYDEIETLFDDDEIISGAAGQRLGITADDVQILQMAALDNLNAEALFDLVSNATAPATPTAKTPPLKPTSSDGAPRVTKKAQKEAEKAAAAANALPVEVLLLYKTHGGMGDTEFAAKIGVSRGTFLNYVSGKSAFNPDDGQRDTLRAQIITDVNGLLEALGLLDNLQYDAFA